MLSRRNRQVINAPEGEERLGPERPAHDGHVAPSAVHLAEDPQAAQAAGISYSDLLDRLIELGIDAARSEAG